MKMNFHVAARPGIFLLMFLLLGVSDACSSGSRQTATDISQSTVPALKPGHWVNEVGTDGYQNVSFDLAADGSISNFNMKASIGVPESGCEITLERLRTQVGKDGTFVISYFIDYDALAIQVGPAVMSVVPIPTGQPYEVLHISGNTTDISMDGTYKIGVCGATMYFGQNTGPWKAQWKNP